MSTQEDLVRVPLVRLQILERIAAAAQGQLQARRRFVYEDTSLATIDAIEQATVVLTHALAELDEL